MRTLQYWAHLIVPLFPPVWILLLELGSDPLHSIPYVEALCVLCQDLCLVRLSPTWVSVVGCIFIYAPSPFPVEQLHALIQSVTQNYYDCKALMSCVDKMTTFFNSVCMWKYMQPWICTSLSFSLCRCDGNISIHFEMLKFLLCATLSTRKSYEFEDLLQSSAESCRVDWYAQSRLGLTRTLSEENVYEDIIGKCSIANISLLTFICFVCSFINRF